MSNSTMYINKGYVATWKFFLGSLCVVAQKAMSNEFGAGSRWPKERINKRQEH